ncbi:MAG: AAA family ATPase, partial [Clostridia bacterium]|nr:AAA family ATPase [Clostridia bacterium]
MKLVRVNITAFGKLKNVAFDFADGVNILQQQNGFGKSTLCAFVRAMLYGLNYNYKLTSGVRMSDVTRYKPWDSTAKFGGSMEICHQCKHYHIERFFGSTAKNESLTVVELATGRQLNIPYPGEYFLGLTVDSYDRCTYLPQEQIDIVSNENL